MVKIFHSILKDWTILREASLAILQETGYSATCPGPNFSLKSFNHFQLKRQTKQTNKHTNKHAKPITNDNKTNINKQRQQSKTKQIKTRQT